MEEDTLTFSRSGLPQILFGAFENMRKQGHLCDLTIKVQNHSFSAHRVILAAGIPYFQKAFLRSAVETGETEIAVEELDPEALESLIHFTYTNEIKISIENAQSLLVASQFLLMNEVRDACVEFLSKRLRADNVLRLRTFACSVENLDLFESCNRFILKNFEQFMKSDDFLSLPPSSIKEIISDDDLNVSSEEVVFEALMAWVKALPDERNSALPELLSEVRMIYLPIHYVIGHIDSEELIISSHPCRNLVNEVKNYHLLTERKSEFPGLKKRPRNQFNFGLYGVCVCDTCGYSVYHFDLTKEVWRVLSSHKAKCKSIDAVVAVNDNIYMFLEATIQTFRLKTREWEVLEPKHKWISGAAIVANKNFIYCFGSKDTIYMQKVRCFDTRLNEWVREGRVKTVRYDHAAASLGDIIYVTGGYNGNTRINTVEKYNTLTGQWSDGTPLLTRRDDHGCCSMNGQVYVCGGRNDVGTTLCTAEVYDPQTEQWNFISSMKNPRFRVSLVSHFNKLYAFEETDVEVYDPKNNEWNCTFSLPGGFRRAVVATCISPKT